MSKESKQRFTSAMSDLKGKLSTEVLEEVNGLLSSLNREFLDVEGDVSAIYKESMTRKEDINSLRTELENLKTEKQSLESKLNDSDLSAKVDELTQERDDYKTKYDEFMTTQNNEVKQKWISKFETVKSHVDFEKAKPFLKLAEEKDGNFDWDTVEIDSLKSNLNELEKLESFGHFKDSNGSPITGTVRETNAQPEKQPWEEYQTV